MFSDALVQIWEKIPQDTKHVWVIQTTSCNKILVTQTSLLDYFFTLIFGVSLNSALCRLISLIFHLTTI